MRMAEPRPLGETSFRAIVRAICDADPAKVRGGACVESVLTVLTQRRLACDLAMTPRMHISPHVLAKRQGQRLLMLFCRAPLREAQRFQAPCDPRARRPLRVAHVPPGRRSWR